MSNIHPLLFAVPAFMATGIAAAQIAQIEPSAPSTPSLTYESAFQTYRPFEAGDVQDWRRSNDIVREVGGWRAYAREIHGAPASTAPAAHPHRTEPRTPSTTMPGRPPAPANPHEGHK
ncbi:hypothetical protein [Ramlibacter sp.]|uniref:hypothetical protein n=1 Tax=Ramlibacter sp. TaxID=1917967 RepID=UPI003D0EE608